MFVCVYVSCDGLASYPRFAPVSSPVLPVIGSSPRYPVQDKRLDGWMDGVTIRVGKGWWHNDKMSSSNYLTVWIGNSEFSTKSASE